MKSNEHIKKFPPGEIPKCAKNQIWEAGDKNWSLGPASTGSIQKPDQPTKKTIKYLIIIIECNNNSKKKNKKTWRLKKKTKNK